MSRHLKTVVRNITSMLLANGLSLAIMALVTFIAPKMLDVENYSYIQLYIFYTTYISYLHWGWVDGIRLRYGGIYYEDINKPLFKSQIKLYSFIQLIIAFLVIAVVLLSGDTGNRLVALLAVGVCMAIRLPRLMPQYILEMSNRIKECARIAIIEKTTFLFLFILLLTVGELSVLTVILADIIGQLLSAIYAFYCCRDILKQASVPIKANMVETFKNIRVGIKLTIANISGLLIIGIVRQFIEIKWDIETFGKISLTISISNLLMVFIRAIAMVLFPTLRRIKKDKLKMLYQKIRMAIMPILLGALMICLPLKLFASHWLPAYQDSLKYMSLLFPICIFESRMSMLIETYYKTFRMEGKLLIINIVSLIMSIILATISIFVLQNLTLAVITVVLVLAFRCIFAERYLIKHMNMNIKNYTIMEVMLVVTYMIVGWYMDDAVGMFIYAVEYSAYLFVIRKDISILFNDIRGVKNEN